MSTVPRAALLNSATVLSAVAASLCCILPVAVALLGVGSAAIGAWFGPWRPVFLVVTVAFLGVAFYQVYRPVDCGPDDACAVRASRRKQRVFLWIVTGFSALLMALPYYVEWLV